MTGIQGISVTCVMVMINFILYFVFGLILTGIKKKSASQVYVSSTVIAGFFFYYSLFTLFAVPITYRWRPLSLLSQLWMGAVIVVVILSIVVNRKLLGGIFNSALDYTKDNKWFLLGCIVLVLVQLVVVLYSYQFTLDAAYYVANVTTTVQTNSLNIYDPYTGDWQDHFEMRYFFATYPLQDAVMCKWFHIPALVQTKLIMASVSLILTNLLYYMIGTELFGTKRKRAVFTMMCFTAVINFFFITIYTSSNFLLTRTYEGKSILANVVLPTIFYLYIRILKIFHASVSEEGKLLDGGRDKATTCGRYWLYLFVVSFGSTVISNSSSMLVPVALGVLFVPLIGLLFSLKRYREAILTLLRMFLCMLPGIILMVIYVAYVKGVFVFYTYPR